MSIRAALLDEQGLFLRIDALADDSALTAQHLPEITECDLPPGEYRWVEGADPARYPQGGCFVPLQHIEEQQRNAEAALKIIDRQRSKLDLREAQLREDIATSQRIGIAAAERNT